MTSPIHGGRRRRSRAPLVIAAVLIVLALGGAAYVSFVPTPAAPSRRELSAAKRPHRPHRRRPPAPPVPAVRLGSANAFSMRFQKPPAAGLVMDVNTGQVLWRRRPLRVLPIASLTKMMTALLVTEHARPDDRVLITRAALHYQGSGVGVLPRGKRVRLETLLNGLLIVSGNDAAIALADHVAGTEHRFVKLMNAKARELGLRCTHFVSSHGLEPGNRSCARDLAVLARLDMENRRITRIVRRRKVSFRFPIKGHRLFLYTHNPLMRIGYPGAIGLKTGYTDAAGLCLVGVARRHGRTLAVILLHSPNPSRHAPRLLDAGFRYDY